MKNILLSFILFSFIFANAQSSTPEIVNYAAKKNIGKVQWCIKKGHDINAKSRSKWTALAYAVKNKDYKMVKILLENDANTEIYISTRETPLLLACKYNYTNIAKLLIQYKADVKFEDIVEFTSLQWAAKYGNKELVELLLANGAEINHKNVNGRTALDVAATNISGYLKSKGAKTGKQLYDEKH